MNDNLLISLPRMTPKDAIVYDGKKYLNMEDKIHEYVMLYMSKDLCCLFKEDPRNGEYENDVANIVANIARVRSNDVLVKPLNKQYFEEFKDRLKVRIISISEVLDEGIYVHKIVRFESVVA